MLRLYKHKTNGKIVLGDREGGSPWTIVMVNENGRKSNFNVHTNMDFSNYKVMKGTLKFKPSLWTSFAKIENTFFLSINTRYYFHNGNDLKVYYVDTTSENKRVQWTNYKSFNDSLMRGDLNNKTFNGDIVEFKNGPSEFDKWKKKKKYEQTIYSI